MKGAQTAGIVVGILLLAFASAVIGCSVNNRIKSHRWQENPDPRGKLYDLGGHRLYARITGSGKNTVIIEGDLGASSPEWWHIQERLSPFATVLTYDRAGYGWSEPGPEPRSSLQIITELEALLDVAGLKGPCILVGHGTGGFYMQHFARRNPGRVRGLVLAEPFSVNEARYKLELPAMIYKNLIDRTSTIEVTGFLASVGVIRTFKVVPYLNVGERDIRSLIIENYSQKKLYRAMESEYGKTLLLNFKQLRESGPFPPVPLTVIHHSPEKYRELLLSFGLALDEVIRIETISRELHRDIAGLSPRGEYIVSDKSGRHVHFDDPEIIIDEVRGMVE